MTSLVPAGNCPNATTYDGAKVEASATATATAAASASAAASTTPTAAATAGGTDATAAAVRDKFKYDEKDLSEWLKARLNRSLTGRALVDRPGMRISLRDSRFEGDVFASSSVSSGGSSAPSGGDGGDGGDGIVATQGKARSVTFSLDVYVYWYGKMTLGDATLGDAEGRICVKDVAYDHATPDWEVEVLFRHQYGQAARNPGSDRELWPVEAKIKACALEEAVGPLRACIKEIHDELAAGRCFGGEAGEAVGGDGGGDGDGGGETKAESKGEGVNGNDFTEDSPYIKDLRRKALNKRFLRVLDGEAKVRECVGAEWRLCEQC
jgi:hypothetical protein